MFAYYLHETYESINGDRDGTMYKAKFYRDIFGEGASKYAFLGKTYGEGPRDGKKCVVKVFKEKFVRKFGQWRPDFFASVKSLEFAENFNAVCIPILNENADHRYKEIDFVIPLIAKMYDLFRFKVLWWFSIYRDDSLVKRRDIVTIEPFLSGTYTKFNSNCGYEDGLHNLILAFSHWTWHISDHRFMVCDLQGVEGGSSFMLTDPAVHSLNQEYGMTDLGQSGMECVLANHTCNSLCRELGLEDHIPDQEVLNPRRNVRSTTYRFQLPEFE